MTDRKRHILVFFRDYFDFNNRPPTLREICTATGISSTSVVSYNVTQLVDSGLMDKQGTISRGLRITRLGRERIA